MVLVVSPLCGKIMGFVDIALRREAMIRNFAVAALMLVSSGVSALNWPWSDTPEERLAYCKGFVTGGLASNQAAEVQRTQLWLAWSYLIRSGAVDHSADIAGYDAGRARFPEELDAASVSAMLDDAIGECGLGRKGRQVTGW